MTAHTPGPWSTRYEHFAYTVFAEDQPGGIAIVACYPAEEEEADARLIAAAPDLLEALKAIRAAIQRAHAETESGGDGGPLAQVSVSFLDGAVNAIRKAEGHE